jgi:putative DNA primase/helicase
MSSDLAAFELLEARDDASQDQPKARRRGAPDRPPMPALLGDRGLPVIQVTGGSLPSVVDQAEQLLIHADCEVYQRGDFVVRPAPRMLPLADQRQTYGLRLVPIKTQHLIERLTRIIDFQKYDARSKGWKSINCPPDVAAAYLQRIGQWRLRSLAGITNAPTLRPDGSILEQPGYDAVTGILYHPGDVTYDAVLQNPTRDDAQNALSTLQRLICEFPFVDQASRSVALSGILTAIIRRSLPTAPLHAYSAPVMGSGKSKLVDIASMIAAGHEAPVIAQGKTEEEMEKRLGAALIAGDTVVSFDNCETALGGELLCQALTQSALSIRILGKSINVTVLNNAAFYATGNNLTIVGDMTRRAIVCSLDPKMERPETRQFKTDDPIKTLRRERPVYVLAALVILRAFHVAGSPEQAVPLGSFEVWSRSVRDPLIWLGEDDPCATMELARTNDPRMRDLAAVLHQWQIVIGSADVTVKRAIEQAIDQPAFLEALLVVAGDRGVINSMRLGRWLGRCKGRVVQGLRVEQGTLYQGVQQWRVVAV